MDLQTITPELAAKLSRRLETQPGDENAERTDTNGANIPVPPVIPQKVKTNSLQPLNGIMTEGHVTLNEVKLLVYSVIKNDEAPQ